MIMKAFRSAFTPAPRSMSNWADSIDDLAMITKQALDYYQRVFGMRYPFERIPSGVRAGLQRRRHGESRLRDTSDQSSSEVGPPAASGAGGPA